MFSENLKRIRKERGFTQESLAIQLHVVRQTVSKWEKGLSVPDAEMLQRLAEVLEVSVAQLLGAEMPQDEADRSEVAELLAKINEQLAVRNRSSRRRFRIVMGILAALILLPIVLSVFFRVAPSQSRTVAGTASYECKLDGYTYEYQVEYNEKYRIISGSSSRETDSPEPPVPGDFSTVQKMENALREYFEARGGTVELVNNTGLKLPEN